MSDLNPASAAGGAKLANGPRRILVEAVAKVANAPLRHSEAVAAGANHAVKAVAGLAASVVVVAQAAPRAGAVVNDRRRRRRQRRLRAAAEEAVAATVVVAAAVRAVAAADEFAKPLPPLLKVVAAASGLLPASVDRETATMASA